MDQHQQLVTAVVEINSLSIIEDDDELDVLLDIDGDCFGISQKYQKRIHQQEKIEATESSHPRRSRQLRRRRRGRKSSE